MILSKQPIPIEKNHHFVVSIKKNSKEFRHLIKQPRRQTKQKWHQKQKKFGNNWFIEVLVAGTPLFGGLMNESA